MMVLPLQDPQEATPPPAHVDVEEPGMANNPRDDEEAVEPLAKADEQAQDIAPPTDSIRRSTRQRRPPERLGTWVYFSIDTWVCFLWRREQCNSITCTLY